ncbi:MAG: hypothetical protein J6P83_03825 [Bacteroidales bacterium]|nr:hypothetical protein [Bacteroidales bacterium]
MKKSFAIIALAALVMLAGCKKNDPKPNGTRLIAGIEKHKSDSKTSLDGTIIKWSESDKLYVNNGTTPATFTLVSGAGTTTGEFATTGEYTFAAENNVAVYPNNYVSGLDNTTVTMTLPAVQTASGAGTFGNGANPMMGTFSDMDNLTLTSLCGVLCLQLTGNAHITAIEIVGGPDDKLNGTFTVDYMNPEPTYPTEGTNTVRLNFTETVTLTLEAQKFYVVVPAGTLHGFTMKVYDGDNEIFSKSTANEVPVYVNTLSTMVPVEVNPYAVPLTLEALSGGTIVVYDPQSGMQYTLNGGAKQTMSGNTEINVSLGDKVQFYGNGTSIASYLGTMITGGTADVKVYGNIMSLVDEENFATATTLLETYTFYRLFNNYDHLTDASGLLLPATTLASANYCYAEMFSYCDNLVAGPSELPATTLSPRCYQAMFLYCSSLTVAPILPATTLEGYCYFQMFRFCTSLTEAPVLPAPELTSNCYREMFSSCSSLNSITCLATSAINSSNSTFNWVIGVASGGTFTKASGANVSTDAGGSGSTWPRGIRGIPEGWMVNDQ